MIIFSIVLLISIAHIPSSSPQQLPPNPSPDGTPPLTLGSGPPVDPSLPRTYNTVRGYTQKNPNVISIGAVLESQEAIAQFLQVIEEVTLEPNINAPGVTLYAVSIPLNQNPVRTAQSVCEKLIKSQVRYFSTSFDASKLTRYRLIERC
jgi:hypothetical protein